MIKAENDTKRIFIIQVSRTPKTNERDEHLLLQKQSMI